MPREKLNIDLGQRRAPRLTIGYLQPRAGFGEISYSQKALWSPIDSAMPGLFCAAQQARSAVAAGTCRRNKRNVALAISSTEA
jgi:hypothetical protein